MEIRELKWHSKLMVMPATVGDRLSNQESAREGALGSKEGTVPGKARVSSSLAKISDFEGQSLSSAQKGLNPLAWAQGAREPADPLVMEPPRLPAAPRCLLHGWQCHGVPLAIAGVKVPRLGGTLSKV